MLVEAAATRKAGCPAFLHRYFPPWSPPSYPLYPSLCSQQQPSPWDCSTIPKLQLPATAPSRGPALLPGICMAVTRTVWFSCHLCCPLIRCFTLSLECFSSDWDNCPHVGSGPLVQFPHLLRAGPVLQTLLFFPLVPCPTEFCMGLYILFHWSDILSVLLPWCSACTSVSEGVFLTYTLREMYSTSTYSSTILFPSPIFYFAESCFWLYWWYPFKNRSS